MKATTLLERQHRNLLQLCEAVERGSASMRASLLPQLAGDLAAHIAVKEGVFYPAAFAVLREKEVWLRSVSGRHAQIMRALDRALAAPLESNAFEEAIGELRTLLTLHAQEEDGGLFPRLEDALEPGEMRDLAVAMMAHYDRAVEAGYAPEKALASVPNEPARPAAARAWPQARTGLDGPPRMT